jgi:ankyrin repeat protein
VKCLLNNCPRDINKEDQDGYTPLLCAISGGDSGIVEYLISKGANINFWDRDGWTPLYHARYEEQYHIVRILLAHGAQDPPPYGFFEDNNNDRDERDELN